MTTLDEKTTTNTFKKRIHFFIASSFLMTSAPKTATDLALGGGVN
jgi:hypothetical protein